MADRVLGVLGGGDMPAAALRAWVESADLVVAADGGANPLAALGLRVDVLVGDLDSASPGSLAHATEVVRDDDQNGTDVDKLLALVAARGHRTITLASVEGDRLDHLLGTLSSALRSALEVRFALRGGIGWLVRAGEGIAIPVQTGRTVSLLPLVACTGVRLSGVRWPLAGSSLALDALVSVSNQAVGGLVEASLASGSALLVAEFAEAELPLW